MTRYLSHPVRRIRADPIAGESASLVVTVADAESSDLSDAVAELSGTVEKALQFNGYLIEVPQPAVDELCQLPAIVRVETANTLSISSDVAPEHSTSDERVSPTTIEE